MQLTRTMMLGLALSLAAGAISQTPSSFYDAKKPWLVRLRWLQMKPDNKSAAFTALSTNFPADSVDLNSKWFPEFDFSYFFNPNFALELVLTYPQEHTVNLAGVGNIGKVTHLPPCLMAVYHYEIPNSNFKPYIGAGFNYTLITKESLSVSSTNLDLDRSSFGFAYQIGADIKIGENMFLNIDFKRVNIKTDVSVAGGPVLTNLKVDPTLFSIGLGIRL